METTTPTLAEMLSVFATLKVNFDPSTDLNFAYLKSKHMKLKLLDGLALLAVTEKAHDMAAVTMTNHVETKGGRTITKFYFMKNRDFTTDEAEYMNNLCDLLNNCPSDQLLTRLYELILPKCEAKIKSRLLKLQEMVREVADLIPSWNSPDQETVDQFSELYPTTPGAKWPDILRNFLCNGLNTDHYLRSEIKEVILLQCHIFDKRGWLSNVESPQLVKRFRKVAQYAMIVVNLSSTAIEGRKRRFYAVNLLPRPPRILQPAIPPALTLINQSVKAMKPDMDPFKFQDIKDMTSSAVKNIDLESGRRAEENNVHCECALAVEMRKFTSEVLQIGVSKHCCWPCAQFLKEYAQETKRFCLTASNGKTYHSWTFPLEISHNIYQKLMDAAKKELLSFLNIMNRRRLSDSNAGSSSDEMEEIETKQFIARFRQVLISNAHDI